MRSALLAATTAMLLSSGTAMAAQQNIQFNLINIGGVDAGTNAYKGFTAAANYWSSVLTTTSAAPITINLNVGFSSLGPNILGQTQSAAVIRQVNFVSSRIIARQNTSFDATLVMPTLHDGINGANSAVNMYTPGYTGVDGLGNNIGIDNETKVYDTDGLYNASNIAVNTANAKAIGYAIGATNLANNADGEITFSSDFKFDFNPRNGILAGTTDFYAVAIHEIGHALGFVSGVDDYDFIGTGGPIANFPNCFGPGTGLCKDYPNVQNDWWGRTLDLFRYSAADTLDWTTGTASYFSADGGATAFQNGKFSTGDYNGDTWQASHWKAPQLPSGNFSCAMPKLGMMNPYICNGRAGIVTGLDLAAFDAIGFNTDANLATYSRSTTQIAFELTNVPEPASWAMMIAGFGLTGAAMRRKRQQAAVTTA
jgi:hypothetical protein